VPFCDGLRPSRHPFEVVICFYESIARIAFLDDRLPFVNNTNVHAGAGPRDAFAVMP